MRMTTLVLVALAATACDPVDETELREACTDIGTEDRLVVPQNLNGWVGYLDDDGQPVAALRILNGTAKCYSYTYGWDHRTIPLPPMVVVDRRDDSVLLYGRDLLFACFAGDRADMQAAEFTSREEAPTVKQSGPVIANAW